MTFATIKKPNPQKHNVQFEKVQCDIPRKRRCFSAGIPTRSSCWCSSPCWLGIWCSGELCWSCAAKAKKKEKKRGKSTTRHYRIVIWNEKNGKGARKWRGWQHSKALKQAINRSAFSAVVNKSNRLSVGRHEQNHYGVTIFTERRRRLIRDLFLHISCTIKKWQSVSLWCQWVKSTGTVIFADVDSSVLKHWERHLVPATRRLAAQTD